MRRVVGDAREAQDGASGVSSLGPPTLDKHLLDYLRVLVKRRWTALAGLTTVLALGGAHAYTATPIYEATVQLLIEHEGQKLFSLDQGVPQDRETTDYYHTQYTILQSRAVAKRAVQALGAWSNQELTGLGGLRPVGMIEGVKRAAFSIVAPLRRAETSTSATPVVPPASREPAPTDPTFETPSQAAVIDAFLARVTVAPVQNSRLVDVRFMASVPGFAADGANVIARVYMEQNLEVRLTASKEQLTGWRSS